MTALAGKTAIITGAAHGIGRAIAERFFADGAKLVLADLNEQGLREVAASLDGETIIEPGDLSKEAAANHLVATALEKFGRIDILVNNAGGGVIRPFLEHTPETLHQTIDRNLWTCLWCCRAVLPHMVQQKAGRIVNIGADSVRNGLWAHAAYNAAKGGMHGLTTGLAREFALDKITVNTVAPCMVATPEVDKLMQSGHELSPLAEKFLSVIPMGRPGEMSEVASAVAYLASDEAAFITGQVMSVNGGSTML